MPTHRRLAAVLAADVVGYSRLIGSDEERTIARLRSIRTQVVDPAIAANHGRLVRINGDGLLVEFASVIDALRCASEMQRQMASLQRRSFPGGTDRVSDRHQRRRDRDRRRWRHFRRWRQHRRPARSAGRRRRHLRLGSGPGGCGRPAGPRLRGHGRAYPEEYRPAGAALSRPARCNGGTGPTSPRHRPIRGCALPDKPSIAVLAFTNMSNETEQEFFADGLAEDIITELSKSRSLFVIARNSSFTYKGKPAAIKDVGRELGVRYVLEGSVRKASQPGAGDGAVDRSHDRRTCLGRTLRPRARRYLCGAGRNHHQRLGRHPARAGAQRARTLGTQAGRQSGCLGKLPSRNVAFLQGRGGGERKGARLFPARDRARSRSSRGRSPRWL